MPGRSRGRFCRVHRLARLIPEDVCAQSDEHHPQRAYLRFDADAQVEFKEWQRVLEQRLRGDELHPALESHLSKYRKLIPALALIHHLVSNRIGQVGLDSLEAACAWGEFLESHAERVYGAAIGDSINGAKTILRRVKAGDLGPIFTRQELHQKKWSGLTELQAVVEATERLEAHHYLHIKKVETGGRPSYVCTLSPKAFSI